VSLLRRIGGWLLLVLAVLLPGLGYFAERRRRLAAEAATKAERERMQRAMELADRLAVAQAKAQAAEQAAAVEVEALAAPHEAAAEEAAEIDIRTETGLVDLAAKLDRTARAGR
jgi:hypothetical protein